MTSNTILKSDNDILLIYSHDRIDRPTYAQDTVSQGSFLTTTQEGFPTPSSKGEEGFPTPSSSTKGEGEGGYPTPSSSSTIELGEVGFPTPSSPSSSNEEEGSRSLLTSSSSFFPLQRLQRKVYLLF